LSAPGGTSASDEPRRMRQFAANLSATLGTLVRKPRPLGGPRPAWPSFQRLSLIAFGAIATVAAAMAFLDARAVTVSRGLPSWLVATFDELTDFGKSGWFLVPVGALLILIALAAMWKLPNFTRLVLAALTVRLGFLFLAIGLPGLFVTILKRLIGRARPFVVEDGGALVFMPFVWRAEYASIPSGHGTNAFAAAIAIGALWPRLRPIMWAYALVIAVSRVVITAHYPSDVIASAFFGVIGAILVRDWFAIRRLGFVVDAAGQVRALPGPSWRHIKTVARRLRSA
jgi:membrane-associated phospholipid phosphatase